MLKSLIIICAVITSTQAYADAQSQALTEEQKEVIRNDFAQANKTLTVKKLVGQYTGTCFDQYYQTTEALYVDSFKNFNGETQVLPMTTLQFYGDYQIPASLKYLTTGAKENLKDVAEFIREGYSGVENNLGYIGVGVDYAYVYNAILSPEKTALTLKVSDVKTSGFNPPVLRGCAYGTSQGRWVFQDCFAANDQTVFKKNAQGQLVSLRTADERLSGTNSFSFRLPAIQQYCTWTKNK